MIGTCVALLLAAAANAEDFQSQEEQIPRKPTAPPPLIRQAPVDIFQCERLYVYKGKRLPCDSNVRRDAEGLRKILDVPEAIYELDTYQRNRRNIRSAAYVATAGLLVIIVGRLISLKFLRDKNADGSSNLSELGETVQKVSLYGGAAITVGSIAYGLTVLKTNEQHLGQAVQYFNAAHPDSPIELQFTTGISF